MNFKRRLKVYVAKKKGFRRDIHNWYHCHSKNEISSGQFGRVYKCKRKRDNVVCAVKVVSKKNFQTVRSEITALQNLEHRNIINLYDVFEDDISFMMVMEYCNGGDLYWGIKKRRDSGVPYTERTAARIIEQVLSAVSYMHKRDICHGDLKPSNIVFSSKEEIKVIDFGYADVVPRWKWCLRKRCGTIFFMAPEIFQLYYSKEGDLWAVGVIMFMILLGYTPFQDASEEAKLSIASQDVGIRARIGGGFKGIPKKAGREISKNAENLIDLLLKKDLSKRFTAKEALASAWLTEASEKDKIPDPVLQQLLQVSAVDNFKAVVAAALRREAHQTTMKDMCKYFKKFDTDGDGSISLNEFKNGLISFSGDHQEFEEIFKNMDVDGNDRISFDEFSTLIAYQLSENSLQRIHNVFNKLDCNNDNYIDSKDFPKLEQFIKSDPLLKRLKINPRELILKADRDGDSRISFQEFLYAIDPELVHPHVRVKLKTEMEDSKAGLRRQDCLYERGLRRQDCVCERSYEDTVKRVKTVMFDDDFPKDNGI